MTAAVSIGLASYTGMPVSTTHVLSSSVAGRCWWMAVVCRKDGDQHSDGRVLTLPAAIILSGVLYWLSLKLI